MTDKGPVNEWHKKRHGTRAKSSFSTVSTTGLIPFSGVFCFAPDITIGRLARMLQEANLTCRATAEGFLIENQTDETKKGPR
tara:strand:+ start:252 stop:497 length:246 start_codon:yes stop_codon:yes gene_type:complete